MLHARFSTNPHHPPKPWQPAAGVGQPWRPGAKDAGTMAGRALGEHGRQQLVKIVLRSINTLRSFSFRFWSKCMCPLWGLCSKWNLHLDFAVGGIL